MKNRAAGKYYKIAVEAVFNSWSILGVLLVCKLVGFLLNGKNTAFDSALYSLLHYAKDSISVLLLTSSSILLLAITLIFEGSPFATLFRNYISIPALNISGHMLSMTAGSTVGWYIIVALENHFDFYILAKVVFIYICSVSFSVMCLSAKPFFRYDLDKLKNQHGVVVTICIIMMGLFSSGIMYFGYVSNFNPVGAVH